MALGPEDERVEEGADEEGCGESGIPVVAENAGDMEEVLHHEIDNRDKYNMETDDDEGADGKVGDNR